MLENCAHCIRFRLFPQPVRRERRVLCLQADHWWQCHGVRQHPARFRTTPRTVPGTRMGDSPHCDSGTIGPLCCGPAGAAGAGAVNGTATISRVVIGCRYRTNTRKNGNEMIRMMTPPTEDLTARLFSLYFRSVAPSAINDACPAAFAS